MQVTLLIGANRLKVRPCLPTNILDYLQEKTKFHPPGYTFSPKYLQGSWEGWIQVFHRKDQTAPTGVYMRLEKLLKGKGYEVSKIFENDYEPKGNGHINDVEPHDYQKAGAKKLIKHRYCIAYMPVRSGKTAVIAMLISKIDHYPVWIITQGKDLVVQTKKEMERFLGRSVGVFSESNYEEDDIIVTSYQALARVFSDGAKEKTTEELRERNEAIKKHIKKTKVLILDESHHAFSPKSKKFLGLFNSIGYRLGLSGTPKPDLLKRIQLEVGIGPIVYKVSWKKLINEGRVAQPLIVFYTLPYDWFRIHLPEYPDIYTANITSNIYRNKFIVDLVKNLWKEKKTTFIMVRHREHGRILQEMLKNSVYVHGDTKTKVRSSLYDRLEKKEIHCIIATVGKEGLNLPRLDAVINAEGYKGKGVTTQKMRSLTGRPEKAFGLVLDFMDRGLYLQDHSEQRLANYKKESSFIVKERRVPKDYFKE